MFSSINKNVWFLQQNFWLQQPKKIFVVSNFVAGTKLFFPWTSRCCNMGREDYFVPRGIEGSVIPTKSFFKVGITKIFGCNNKMFSSINKKFGCSSKIFGCSNKKFICCP